MVQVVVFLSPHLDDVVLSCPAFLQRLKQQGCDVRVATFFSEGGPEAGKLYRRRRSEDRLAVRRLGATALHLGLLDAPFRSPTYKDFCGIVFGRAGEYAATRRQVAQAIADVVSQWSPDRVVAPMAVGNHVDHRLVRDAALARAPSEMLFFYEDRPYAFVREQVGHVLGRRLILQPERVWKRYFAAAYVRHYRGRTTDSRIIRAWANVPAFPPGYRLHRADRFESSPDELAVSLAAIRSYHSQLPDLFEDQAEMQALYQRLPERIYRATWTG